MDRESQVGNNKIEIQVANAMRRLMNVKLLHEKVTFSFAVILLSWGTKFKPGENILIVCCGWSNIYWK